MKGLRRRSERLTLESVAEMAKFNGHSYPLFGKTMTGSPYVEPAREFEAYVRQIHDRNGVVAAAVAARSMLMSQLRFTWRRESDMTTFGNTDLAVLEKPAPGFTRSRMLTVAEQHVSYAGSAYFWRQPNPDGTPGPLHLLNPAYTSVLIGSDSDPDDPGFQADAHVLGVMYRPGGKRDRDPQFFPSWEVAQHAPEPDPVCWWRGSSWVTSVVREIVADGQATDHLTKFFENAATPQMVFSLDKELQPDAVKRFADLVNEQSAGTANAYRNLFLGGGADVQVVGSMLQQLDMKGLQGGSESRVAARSRVPATVLGIREGMQGSALNAGNYSAARRMWADGWFSPVADILAETLEQIVPAPGPGVALAPDTSRVLFLQEDRKDEADIQAAKSQALRNLVDAGYTPDSAAAAIHTNDFRKLVHSGLYSVQLQEAGTPAAPQTQEG